MVDYGSYDLVMALVTGFLTEASILVDYLYFFNFF